VEQHEREQPDRFGLGQQLDEQPSEPDRFSRKIGTRERVAGGRRVPFVEDQVDDVKNGVETAGEGTW
jgi:hypothetical protein